MTKQDKEKKKEKMKNKKVQRKKENKKGQRKSEKQKGQNKWLKGQRKKGKRKILHPRFPQGTSALTDTRTQSQGVDSNF